MLRAVRSAAARTWLRDLAALALLAGLALAAAGFLLRNDLFLYGDHPGQFMRLWYPVRVSHHLLGWNPLWYAGYPELQFYPPGFVLLGWLLDLLTLGRLEPFALYQLLLFVAYLLPGMTVYLLLSAVTRRRWMGLVGGVLALAFDGLWGGTAALFVGLVAERLAFGLVPLVMLAGWRAVHAPGSGYAPRSGYAPGSGYARRSLGWWLLLALALAATLLMHPFHTVGPLLFLALLAVTRPGRWRLLAGLVGAGTLAAGLAAFWLLPLLAHSEYAAPMLRADIGQSLDWLFGPGIQPYLGAALLSLPLLAVERLRPARPFLLATLATALALVAFVLFDHLVLLDRLGFFLLDPVRFSAEIYLAWVLLAGLGLAWIPAWFARGSARRRWVSAGLGALVLILLIGWLARPTLSMLREHRDPAHFLAGARGAYGLDEAWEELAGGTGRVLFTSHYLHLGQVPTALKAATPYFAGRPIVGGTFSHWSPVARVLWVGRTDVDLLPGQVELSDDLSLGGRPWPDWTDVEFLDLCRDLNVTTVAATWDDANARTFLDAAPHFVSYYSDDLFVLYRVLDAEPALVEVEGPGTAALLQAGPAALEVRVEGAAAGSVLRIKITDYPLWQVRRGDEMLAHRPDGRGLMTVSLPPGNYDLALSYRPGPVERLSSGLSLAAAALGLILAAAFVRSYPVHKPGLV